METTNGAKKFVLNTGDILHLVQIAIMLISLGAFYQKLQAGLSQVEIHTQQLDRVEHYLSSKDPDYWHRAKEYQ